MMEAILGVDADFFALQTQVPSIHPANLTDISEEMVTLADTAALIEEMDVVITVDTSVVHLAGAIGKEAWLLLPHRYEWRWSLEGERNNWYDSVRVLRQRNHGDWSYPLEEVFQHLLPDLVAKKGADA
jgi:ADP-heptose:LPS heptosyltransferase